RESEGDDHRHQHESGDLRPNALAGPEGHAREHEAGRRHHGREPRPDEQRRAPGQDACHEGGGKGTDQDGRRPSPGGRHPPTHVVQAVVKARTATTTTAAYPTSQRVPNSRRYRVASFRSRTGPSTRNASRGSGPTGNVAATN